MAQLLEVLSGVRRSLCAGLMSPALASDLEERLHRSLRQSFAAHTSDHVGDHHAKCRADAFELALAEATTQHNNREVSISETEISRVTDDGTQPLQRHLAVGRVKLPLIPPSRPELVPDIHFTDNAMHMRMLEVCATLPTTFHLSMGAPSPDEPRAVP